MKKGHVKKIGKRDITVRVVASSSSRERDSEYFESALRLLQSLVLGGLCNGRNNSGLNLDRPNPSKNRVTPM
jgi:hypothetical protein